VNGACAHAQQDRKSRVRTRDHRCRQRWKTRPFRTHAGGKRARVRGCFDCIRALFHRAIPDRTGDRYRRHNT